MNLAHVIALEPTVKQANALARAAGVARFAYNWGLGEWERQRAAGLKPKIGAIKKTFNALKGTSFPWIYESPKDANQQAFADLGKAFDNFFRWQRDHKGPKVGYPTRRKKGRSKDGFYVSNDKFHFHADADTRRVHLPVIGSVKMREHLRLSGKILGARILRRAGRWFLAVQVDGERRRPNVHFRAKVGVDLGLKTAVVVSRGGADDQPEHIEAPKPLKQSLKALRRANRVLHRRKKGSRNRFKAQKKVARVHARVANVRKDFLHKITTRLCRENQAIVIEDLNVAGMLKNHGLARAIADVGFGMFRQFLSYKASIFGSEVIVADRWFPSSKRCSACGSLKDHLDLSERTYKCEACSAVLDRDDNASLNLERYLPLGGEPSRIAGATSTETFTSTGSRLGACK